MLARIFLAFVTLVGVTAASQAQILFEEYCNPDAVRVVLMLDITTPYDEIDRSVLKESALKIFDRLDDGQELAIVTIEDSFSHSRKLLEACIPFCPADASIVEILLSSCTEGVLLQRRRELAARLREVLTLMLDSSSELSRSDIIRTIYYATSRDHLSDADNHPTNLYIFSDMLENSGLISGRDFFGSKAASLIQKVQQNDLIPSLMGANVWVFGVGRRYSEGRPELSVAEMQKVTDFWRDFFDAGGAATVEISPRFDF